MEHLYLEKNLILESSATLKDAKFALLGVPFDSTASYRPGSRFAPLDIRKEFLELEKGVFFDIPFVDLGNVDVIHGNAIKTLDRVNKVVEDVRERNPKIVLIVLGGEHTITQGVIRSRGNVDVLQLDAHADLRDDHSGEEFSHATVMRRISELGISITQVGVRSFSEEEVKYAKEKGIRNYQATEFDGKDMGGNVYISVDLDVLDPAVAPGISNPEPGGISFNTLNAIIINATKAANVVGLDLVEVNPMFDNHTTSVVAAKLMLNFIIERYKGVSTIEL